MPGSPATKPVYRPAAPNSAALNVGPYKQKGRWISPAAFPGPCEAGNLHVSLMYVDHDSLAARNAPGTTPAASEL